MKIVFMGTPEFACPPLKALSNSRHKILAVITGIDKKSGRGRKLTQAPVAELALELGLPVIKASGLKDESLHQKIKSLSPDLIVVIAFRILPESLINIPKLGAINIHGSLLPKYRGAAPINWALINGEKETGLSSFFLKKKVDTGNIILREKIEINPDDNFSSLYNRLSEMSAKFLLDSLDKIEEPGFEPSGQRPRRADDRQRAQNQNQPTNAVQCCGTLSKTERPSQRALRFNVVGRPQAHKTYGARAAHLSPPGNACAIQLPQPGAPVRAVLPPYRASRVGTPWESLTVGNLRKFDGFTNQVLQFPRAARGWGCLNSKECPPSLPEQAGGVFLFVQ